MNAGIVLQVIYLVYSNLTFPFSLQSFRRIYTVTLGRASCPEWHLNRGVALYRSQKVKYVYLVPMPLIPSAPLGNKNLAFIP